MATDKTNSWDNPDLWGRRANRLGKSADAHIKKALKSGDYKSLEAWSIVLSRHSRDALALMQFKRMMLLDLGIPGSGLSEEQRATVAAQGR